jgi:hypothetical protein
METIEPSVTSLKKTCPFVVVEHNYSGSQKDGFTKGEVEWAIWDSDSVVKDEKGAFTYEYIEHHEEHALILEGIS